MRDRFRSEGEPIGLEELTNLELRDVPKDIRLLIRDDYFPDAMRERLKKFCAVAPSGQDPTFGRFVANRRA